MKLLSIIVPMYNVADYVERCIRSLQEQDINAGDYEIICINDGSPDNCKEIIQRLQTEFFNILLIDQENQGVSRARNNGIKMAKGHFILFIDPDDYIEANSLGGVVNRAFNNDVQVSFLGFSIIANNGKTKKDCLYQDFSSKVFNGIDISGLSRMDGKVDPDRMWAVLYNTQFIKNNNLFFLPDVPYLEDGELIFRILCIAQRCTFDGHPFYKRTIREGSATRSRLFYSSRATDGFVKAAKSLKEFQVNTELTKDQIKFLNQPIVKFVVLTIQSSFDRFNIKRVFNYYDKLKTAGLKQCKLESCNNIYKFYGLAYNISPFLCLLFLFLLPRFKKAGLFFK
ncbi:MAG: glycosyltransferase [Marinilabiliaceae bacterium]|nr:glycosyltransferase [Marinilabiliaceae bacterium]